MNVTANKAIIYDDTCPLCVWYTGVFVKTGMLKEDNRISFNELADKDELTENMDLHRSKHEIPLVDLKGGETLYGLDSLVCILSQKMPFIACLLQFRPIRAFFKTLYNIVSYNRRVIVGAAKTTANNYDCTPDFHVAYRLVYIVLGILVSAFGGYWFANGMVEKFAAPVLANFNYSTLAIAAITWGMYGCIALLTIPNNRKRIEYFGQLATILLMGFGIYVAVMGMVKWIPNEDIALIASCFAVLASIGVMSRAHLHRLKVVNLGVWRIVVWLLSLGISAMIVFI